MMKKRSKSSNKQRVHHSADEFQIQPHLDLQLSPEGMSHAPPAALPAPKSTSWRWLLLGSAVCGAAGSMAVGAFLWLISLPPVANCQQISSLSPDRERLYCAQTAASEGDVTDLLAGMELVEQWTPDHALYQEAQQSLAEWSEAILKIARDQIHQNDLEGAIALVQQIPKSSPTYDQAQATLAEWQQEWQQGRAIYAKAQDALKRKNWDQASEQIVALAELDYEYWRSEQTAALSQQILAEQQAHKYLVQARNLAKGGTPDRMAAAIKTAAQINQDTYTWKEIQPNLNQWSERLLALGLQQWKDKNFDRVITLGRQVSLNPALAKEAQHLIWLAEARQQAIASLSNWTASTDQVWHLIRAIAIANQISSDSQFYPLARASVTHWQTQLQDLTQLHVAQLMANFRQIDALNLAIDQAQMVTSDRPRRVQAQTLVAHWSREVQRIEDQPHLTKAEQLAAPGTVPALRNAIAEAKQVAPGRALRAEAQGRIATWQKQIERIQDQPFLDRAQRWAAQGDLAAAIDEASAIQPGRALYRQAQGAIDEWRSRIRAAERARRARQEAAARAERQRRYEEATPADDVVQPEQPRDFTDKSSGGIILPSDVPSRSAPEPLPPEESPQPMVQPPQRLQNPSLTQPAPEEVVVPPPPPPPRPTMEDTSVQTRPFPSPDAVQPVQVPIAVPTPTEPEAFKQDPYSRLSDAAAEFDKDVPAIYAGALYMVGMV